MRASGVAALAAFYHDSLDINDPHQRMITSHRLVAKIPTIAAMAYKFSVGQPFVYPPVPGARTPAGQYYTFEAAMRCALPLDDTRLLVAGNVSVGTQTPPFLALLSCEDGAVLHHVDVDSDTWSVDQGDQRELVLRGTSDGAWEVWGLPTP